MSRQHVDVDPLKQIPALAPDVRQAVARARIAVLERLQARQDLPLPYPSESIEEQRQGRLRHLNGQLGGHGSGSIVHELADDLPLLSRSMPQIALTDEERIERQRSLRIRLLRRRLEDLELSLAETLPFRIRISWRIVREIARLKNLVSEDELLTDLKIRTGEDDEEVEDPWKDPVRGPPPTTAAWSRRMDPILMRALKRSLTGGAKGKGTPLLPPAVPEIWRLSDGLVNNEYDPGKDMGLLSFLQVASMIAGHYAMADFETERGAEGELGLEGMLDVDTARMCWPSRRQILAFEETVVGEVRDFLSVKGLAQSRQYLVDAHGLRQREIDSVIKMAASSAVELTDFSPEEQRALMILQIEDHIARAREELNLTAEQRGLKLKVLVQGLAKMDTANPFAEFATAVESAKALADEKDDTPQLEVIDVPVLPPPEIKDG